MQWYYFCNKEGKKGLAEFCDITELIQRTRQDIAEYRKKASKAESNEERNAWEYAARAIEKCSIWTIHQGKEKMIIQTVKEGVKDEIMD